MRTYYHNCNQVLKETITWNKYKSKVTIEIQNQYFDVLFDPSFQEVYRLFVLSCEDNAVRIGHRSCFLRTVEINNIMIDGRKFFD